MYAPLLRLSLFRDRQREVVRYADLYETELDRTEIERDQVGRFNEIWKYCLAEVPFYRAWAREHGLPQQITSVGELRDFPVLTKAVIVERASEVFQHGDITAAYSTGGTSGEPARYPRGENDGLAFYANIYSGRAWWGIRPFDSYLHLWGHSHLFGESGVRGGVQRLKRKAADTLANATRVSAYEMSADALRSHYHALVRRNPAYIVGYTSAVFKFARHIESSGAALYGLTKLRAVVVTSETVTPADVDLIARVFGVPVIIEYGSAETSVMATSRGGSWPLQVLWQSFIMRLDSDGGDVVVTTLNNRLFPLVNYSIGDRAEAGDVVDGNALTLASVAGGSYGVVVVGTTEGGHLELSALLPLHILKMQPGVTAVQFRQESASDLRIFLSADHDLSLDSIAASFTSQLLHDHPNIDPESVAFEQVTEPLLTKAGKQALFV